MIIQKGIRADILVIAETAQSLYNRGLDEQVATNVVYGVIINCTLINEKEAVDY